MRLALSFLSLFIAASSSADEIFSTRVFSTSAETIDLPSDLSFNAGKIHVVDANWFTSIFEKPGCELSLAEADLNYPIEIKSVGPRTLSLTLGDKISRHITDGRTSYVPLYYKNSRAIHPHFMVKLKNWVLLHVTIHKSDEKKHLRISLVQVGKDGGPNTLQTILEADGI